MIRNDFATSHFSNKKFIDFSQLFFNFSGHYRLIINKHPYNNFQNDAPHSFWQNKVS